ncbi:F0F1 ATP synthase subunit gamma [Candidatus Saccharibacteria bacterium]|nr:F0F1 ATP synthase subunit gamma [Candidatus Saccharibacteria bacterium]MBP9985774.1 F0F1 ATP synthase subunit gamma [Candidatus Saccharibacteria bacterium]
MRRANIIEKDITSIGTLKNLTNVFESLASNQVAKVKHRAGLGHEFFQMIWKYYTAIRVDPKKRLLNRPETNGRTVFILISAEAGLSGDLDVRTIDAMQKKYNPETTDIIVLGSHGANQLSQREIPYIKFFQTPESDGFINVEPIINIVKDYSRIVVYYAEYISLGQQEVRTVDLLSQIQEMGENFEEGVITDDDTIFEPSLNEIALRMEATMMNLALSQTILQSKLAQAASRFNAMTVAEDRASELLGDYKLEFHRAKRSENDKRLREVLVGIKKKRREQRSLEV